MDVELRERLARLEEKTEHIITKVDDIKNNHLPSIYKKIEKVTNRPSWIVTVIITFLSSLSVGLIVRILTIKK